MSYKNNNYKKPKKYRKSVFGFLSIVTFVAIGGLAYLFLLSPPTLEEIVQQKVSFDASLTPAEQTEIREKIIANEIEITDNVYIRASLFDSVQNKSLVMQTYVPVTNVYSPLQKITKSDLQAANVLFAPTDNRTSAEFTKHLGIEELQTLDIEQVAQIAKTDIAYIPVDSLDATLKLLEFDGNYYLDTFTSGAVFRELVFEGADSQALSSLELGSIMTSDQVFKVNMSGVTALTRVMQRKLSEVGDPLYFSAKIGDFLADADLTHVSNEVSFKPDCGYSNVLFCSPPEFIETLKASGVDLVEITGNHNNDLGSEFNSSTIALYKSLGWGVYGGGSNTTEAAQPFLSETKGSRVNFLAYNYPDSPNGGAIAGADSAGANSFDFSYASIKSDIESARESSDFVIVNVQYWECYAYPDGYIEFPTCDVPIGDQEETFKKLIDLGADMVIGSSAHQPQTYELYNGKPIYYGLGNMYFDQTSWPGTERGIILTHYFDSGRLLQTKLTPTVYDTDLQTRIMTDEEANYLLTRLDDAR